MVDIIHLNDDPHEQTQLLLPWYVNGALTGAELAKVVKHLSSCAECREDVAMERAMAAQIKALPGAADSGWAKLKARVDGAETAPDNGAVTPFRRRIPLWWALAAQAASLAILVPLATFGLMRPPPALYRTLGSPPSAAAGNVIVVFRPESSEATLRAILVQNQARIVDGPTSTDAYVLHVAAEQRQAVLARLKSDRNVVLAEPIDGDNH